MLQQGLLCPTDVSKIDLEIQIDSQTHIKPTRMKFSIPVVPYDLQDIEAKLASLQKLEVKSFDVSMMGRLAIEFNKAIMTPAIKVTNITEAQD